MSFTQAIRIIKLTVNCVTEWFASYKAKLFPQLGLTQLHAGEGGWLCGFVFDDRWWSSARQTRGAGSINYVDSKTKLIS